MSRFSTVFRSNSAPPAGICPAIADRLHCFVRQTIDRAYSVSKQLRDGCIWAAKVCMSPHGVIVILPPFLAQNRLRRNTNLAWLPRGWNGFEGNTTFILCGDIYNRRGDVLRYRFYFGSCRSAVCWRVRTPKCKTPSVGRGLQVYGVERRCFYGPSDAVRLTDRSTD